jgi:hypothetical protein
MRNADKDREIIANAEETEWLIESSDAWPHWLERAVSAEQRVAELEELAQRTKQQWDIEREECAAANQRTAELEKEIAEWVKAYESAVLGVRG